MEIVILLVPLGLFLAGVAVAAFLWGLRRGQFDDLDSRGWGVVFDDQARDRRATGDASAEGEDVEKEDNQNDEAELEPDRFAHRRGSDRP